MPLIYTKENFKEIEDIILGVKNVKFLSKKQLPKNHTVPETYEKEIKDNVADVFRFYNDVLKKDSKRNTKQKIIRSEFEEQKSQYKKMLDDMDLLIKRIFIYGKDASKEQLAGLKLVKTMISRDVAVMEGYRGKFPVTYEDIFTNQPINEKKIDKKEVFNDDKKFESLQRAMRGTDYDRYAFHKDSVEYTAMIDAVNEMKKAFDLYADYNSRENLTNIEIMTLGEKVQALKLATEKYIQAKGGPGKQYSKMGKDRMDGAVAILEFIDNVEQKYPTKEMLEQHFEHLETDNYPEGVQDEAKGRLFDLDKEEIDFAIDEEAYGKVTELQELQEMMAEMQLEKYIDEKDEAKKEEKEESFKDNKNKDFEMEWY